MAESTVPEDFKKGEPTKRCGYFKMKKFENLKSKTAEKLIRSLIDKNALLQTDESITYSKFKDFIDVHLKELSGTKEGRFNLNWAHTAIINFKSDLRKFTLVTEGKLQNYLNKFLFKLKRRIFNEKLSDRLVIASIQSYCYSSR